ncbi:MAG: hypothetical protein A2046_13795 [Bacteroidetes bacterium GWA2_30_7]|nr:MAG: hypothetical protein A2046_13795 [Bacteroidetes bacterium GWA2_30_7]
MNKNECFSKLRMLILMNFFIILLLSSLKGFTQIKLTIDSLKLSPPGTVWVKDNIYIDQFPVTNADYTEFLLTVSAYYNPKIHDTIQKIKPYNVNWKKLSEYFFSIEPDDEYMKKLEQEYYSPLSWTSDSSLQFSYYDDEYYSNYPIINISYEQAKEYCKWRTDMVLLSYAINVGNKKKRDVFYTKFAYRLPKFDDWKSAYDLFEIENEPFTKPVSGEDSESEYFHYSHGNVSEMLDEKGKAVGLSWKDMLDVPKLINPIQYQKPSDWLGFRCVCEILEY